MPPAKNASDGPQSITLRKVDIRRFSFTIENRPGSPVILHRFSEKARKEMLDAMTSTKKRKEIRGAKDPHQEYLDSVYELPDGRVAFPAEGFKACAVRGGKAAGMVMTDLRSSFFIVGVYSPRDGRELVPLIPKEGFKVESREDVVRLPNGSSDLRYRAQITDWTSEIIVDYNASVISPEQIVNAFEAGGFGTGIGEWRPERSGSFGRFHVVTSE